MKEKNTIIAKTLFGLEELLGEELRELGAQDINLLKRGVSFEGDDELLYRLNYSSRLALRFLKPVATFKIKKQRDLYSRIFDIPWEEIFDVGKSMMIDSVIYSSHFRNTHFAAQLAKDGIADRFRFILNKRPDVKKEDPDIRINIHLTAEDCTVSLDSSGKSLHQRGYRQKSVEAPLNEVLAAGLVRISGWDGTGYFIDPFCGSGTLLIEAAMAAKNIPAGYYRDHYSFQHWKKFDHNTWKRIKREADQKISEPNLSVYGFDKSARAVVASRVNIRHTGLEKDIKVEEKSFQELKPFEGEGIIITNPPYGERLNVQNNHVLYQDFGVTLKNKFTGFSAWILSGDLESLKHVGLRSSKKIKLFNGQLECRFVNFEMYEGKREDSRGKG